MNEQDQGKRKNKAIGFVAEPEYQDMWAVITAESNRSTSNQLRFMIRVWYGIILKLQALGLWPPRDVVDDWPGEEPGESENDDAGVS